MRLKTLAMIINPQLYAAVFAPEPVDEEGLVQWTPETEQDVAMAMDELKALGILS